MLDVDVPWIESRVQPQADARLFHIDCDPLKQTWGSGTSRRAFMADRQS
ncbi:MAG: hypothetical protein WKG52_08405 [Variovorax sp.]